LFESISFCKKRLRFKKLVDISSSFSCASQLESSVSISSLSSSFCSGFRDEIHASLSNLTGVGSGTEPLGAPPLVFGTAGLGAPKNDDKVPSFFGRFSSAESARATPLRLSEDISIRRSSRGGIRGDARGKIRESFGGGVGWSVRGRLFVNIDCCAPESSADVVRLQR
jgi:hypothetical protein